VPTSTSSPGPIPLNPPLAKGDEKKTQRGFAPLHALCPTDLLSLDGRGKGEGDAPPVTVRQ
jgi:hypothetical protein